MELNLLMPVDLSQFASWFRSLELLHCDIFMHFLPLNIFQQALFVLSLERFVEPLQLSGDSTIFPRSMEDHLEDIDLNGS